MEWIYSVELHSTDSHFWMILFDLLVLKTRRNFPTLLRSIPFFWRDKDLRVGSGNRIGLLVTTRFSCIVHSNVLSIDVVIFKQQCLNIIPWNVVLEGITASEGDTAKRPLRTGPTNVTTNGICCTSGRMHSIWLWIQILSEGVPAIHIVAKMKFVVCGSGWCNTSVVSFIYYSDAKHASFKLHAHHWKAHLFYFFRFVYSAHDRETSHNITVPY
jgi:hypothetical protein